MDALVHAGADRVRRFNRFWTREIGLLQEGLLDTPHSLTEARVIYELGQVPETTASALAQALDLDPGHLSRVLAGLDGVRHWSPASARRTTAGASSSRSRAGGRALRRARPPLGRAVSRCSSS